MRESFIVSSDKNNGYPSFPDSYDFERIDYSNQLMFLTSDGYPVFKNKNYPDSVPIINTVFYTYGNTYPLPFWMLLYLTPDMYPYKVSHVYVYDMAELQEKFSSNGLAVLSPSHCEITEELNGMYELTLTHPIDETGKWKYLLELNIIKADGQLFRIYSKKTSLNNDGSMERTVYARHIFYDLNDKLLHDVRPENKNGQEFISWVMTHIFNDSQDEYHEYEFSYSSDIKDTATSYFQSVSPVAAFIGADNCFINRLGGELYRDNFYFSINKIREKSMENAFSIRYGLDMLKVEETIDYSDLCTYLICNDNFGNMFAVSYVGTQILHHNVTKELNFNYESDDINQLIHDGQNYFGSVCTPKITYTVIFANIKNDSRYSDFMELQHCNVGDTGTIYCEQLGINTIQKVIKKTYNPITNEVTSLILGNMKSSLTRWDKYSGTISSGSSANDKRLNAIKSEIDNNIALTFGTYKRLNNYVYTELSAYTYKILGGK